MSPEQIRTFLSAGRAVFTITSTATGRSYTFRFGRPHDNLDGGPIFASVLTGPDNSDSASYSYMGMFNPQSLEVRPTKGSRVAVNAPSFVALAWFLRHIGDPRVEFRHEGRCGRCGRALTVPESIDSGLGPECAGKVNAA